MLTPIDAVRRFFVCEAGGGRVEIARARVFTEEVTATSMGDGGGSGICAFEASVFAVVMGPMKEAEWKVVRLRGSDIVQQACMIQWEKCVC